MAFGGIGLGDLPLIGADIFNARASAEEENARLQREEEERQARRRREALEMAVSEVQLDNARTTGARHKAELARINQGLPPTPPVPRAGDTPSEPIIGLGVRGSDDESFAEFLDRRRQVGEVDADTARATTRAREEEQEKFRLLRPDAPLTLNEIQDGAMTVVNSILAGNPLMPADDVVAHALTNPEIQEAYPDPIRSMMEGGQITSVMLRDAWQRVRGDTNLNDAQVQGILRDIEAGCRAGIDPATLETNLSQNREAVDNRGSLKRTYYDYIQSTCSG